MPPQVVCRPPGPGQGTVEEYDPALSGWELTVEGVTLLLGGWWLPAAARGGPDTLPVINLNPALGIEESGVVRMVKEAATEEEREELERRVAEEEERDREEEAGKEYTGLIPEVYQATASALLGELEEDGEELVARVAGAREAMEARLAAARSLLQGGLEGEGGRLEEGEKLEEEKGKLEEAVGFVSVVEGKPDVEHNV